MEWIPYFVTFYTCFVIQCSAMSISELEDFANFMKKTSKLDEPLRKGTYDYDEDEPVSDHAWEDSGKFEGDLILNDRQRRTIVDNIAEGLSRNGLTDSTKRWPDNELVYYIQKEHFSDDQVQAINDGIEDLARASCVKFRPYKKGDRDAVVIQGNRRGCFSQVGYQGGYQVLNLSGRHPAGRGCFRHGTIIHELLHSLGFYHMQSSPDRDDYVDIVWENIARPARHNFRKYNAFSVSDFGVGYDYDSVLHYSRRAFSNNGQATIVPKQDGAEIGQRTGLSDKDSQKLNKMYCDADSNNQGEESITRKPPTKRKKPTNKPFEGQGIGYHQGKTVVIKLLPDEKTKTYKLNSDPEFYVFDRFSKPSQDLSEKEIEKYGVGGFAVNSFKPYYQDVYNLARVESENKKKLQISSPADDTKPTVAKHDEVSNENEQSLAKPPNNDQSDPPYTITDDVLDAFDRLSKIIKTHVYPSQKPDFSAYKSSIDFEKLQDFKTLEQYSPTSKSIENQDKSSEQNKNYQKDHSKETEQIKQGHDKDQNIQKSHEFIKPQITEEDEKSYRTSYPFKTHQHFSNRSIEIKTPDYAKRENLENKHNYSHLYHALPHDESEEIAKHHLFRESVPLNNDWYNNEQLNHNPANYDEDSNDKENEKLRREHESSESEENEYPSRDTRNYYTGSYSPQKKQAYELFGVPVPLTKDWYRI